MKNIEFTVHEPGKR